MAHKVSVCLFIKIRIQWNLSSHICVIRNYLDLTQSLYTNESFNTQFNLSNPTKFYYPNECRIRQVTLYPSNFIG